MDAPKEGGFSDVAFYALLNYLDMRKVRETPNQAIG
jgi:hypothetical protein